jgi:hypothetical protein
MYLFFLGLSRITLLPSINEPFAASSFFFLPFFTNKRYWIAPYYLSKAGDVPLNAVQHRTMSPPYFNTKKKKRLGPLAPRSTQEIKEV